MSVLSIIKLGLLNGKNFIIKHGPKIAVGIGTICATAGAVDACIQTTKASAILDEHKAKMDEIHRAMELAKTNEVEYSEKDRKKDTIATYGQTTVSFVKLYWRPTVLFVGGFASIFGGFGVLSARHAAAIGAFTSLSETFNNYRSNVADQYGTDVDYQMLVGDNTLKKTKYLKPATETEEAKEIETNAIDLSVVDNDMFTFRFNYKNPCWQNHYLWNQNLFEAKAVEYTRRFQNNSIDHLFVSKMYEIFGFDRMPEYTNKCSYGAFYGWMNRPGVEVKIMWTPYIETFSADESSDQFPMEIPIDIKNDEAYQMFLDQYREDETKVGYYVTFLVDTDSSDRFPEEIYSKVYGLNA